MCTKTQRTVVFKYFFIANKFLLLNGWWINKYHCQFFLFRTKRCKKTNLLVVSICLEDFFSLFNHKSKENKLFLETEINSFFMIDVFDNLINFLSEGVRNSNLFFLSETPAIPQVCDSLTTFILIHSMT